MKNFLKSLIVAVLGWQVRRLYKHNHIKTVGVVGSIGKTSTKSAIAQVLAREYYVQYQDGNYNDIVTIPLVFFGQKLPSLFNPFAWVALILRNEWALRHQYPYEVVVLELGTDGPGQIKKLNKYLKIDTAVVTAISPEHMEFFADEDAIAREELSVQNFSKQLLVNADLCSPEAIAKIKKPCKTYGKNIEADYRISGLSRNNWNVTNPAKNKTLVSKLTISDAEVYSLSAAFAVGQLMDMKDDQLLEGIASFTSISGRMNILKGQKGSIIIDDTYNASPQATTMALQTLYDYPAKQRIALLGNMNELGRQSEMYHRQVGAFCDPDKLALIVTLGTDANKFLAAEAEKRGCKVVRATTPTEAAGAIESAILSDTVILAKGSQNGVFAEEAVKQLLANPEDETHLVRQGAAWLSKKESSFK